jgi:hypothetical protein
MPATNVPSVPAVPIVAAKRPFKVQKFKVSKQKTFPDENNPGVRSKMLN